MNKPSGDLSRRDILKLAVLATSAASLTSLSGCAKGKERFKNIIFLVSDGMSTGVPSLAEPFSQHVRKKETFWHQLSCRKDVTHGLFDMASQDTLVTDSAAAASAWGSGQRVPNRMLNQYIDGVKLTPLCLLLKKKGVACGLVTTSRMTHATPAGFCASVPHRDYEELIAAQYLNQVDILLGGGSIHFMPEHRDDSRDLRGEFRGAGYTFVEDKKGLEQAKGKEKILGLFYPDHLPYTVDQQEDAQLKNSVPTLAEMAQVALEGLSKKNSGFFLMVEGARVDHAAHANDGAGILWEQLAFDDAVGVALEFQKNNPDTLVVVSSDHGNANPGLNGTGPAYTESTGSFGRVTQTKQSALLIMIGINDLIKSKTKALPQEIIKLITKKTGLVINEKEAQILVATLTNLEIPEIADQQKNFFAQYGQMMGNWTGIGWTGVTHTADWTLRMALGPGQEQFSGLMKNTEFFERVTSNYGIDFRNPAFTGQTQVREAEQRPQADPTG